jgi:hypothetical protein
MDLWRNEWEEISQDIDSKRAFIDMLDIRVTVIMTPEGKRKGLLTGKLPVGLKNFVLTMVQLEISV